jgi:hypothetical protein
MVYHITVIVVWISYLELQLTTVVFPHGCSLVDVVRRSLVDGLTAVRTNGQRKEMKTICPLM